MIFVTAGQKKGWMIIGADLILVLFVYILFTQVQVNEESVQRRQNGITYRLIAEPENDGQIPVRFRVTSRRTSPYTIELPEGITLMISNGQKTVYARETIQQQTMIEIQPEQSRQWSQTFSLPEEASPPYYAGFFIDSDRQALVEVPG